MQIISFGWTAPAILARQKTVTRRDWKDSHARKFHKGDLVQAYDKSPRYGGKKIAVIRLTKEPYKELSCHIPDEDYEAEGFEYLDSIGATIVNDMPPWMLWTNWLTGKVIERWVIRFEIVKLEGE